MFATIVTAGPLQLRGFRDPHKEPQIFLIEIPVANRSPQQDQIMSEALKKSPGYQNHVKISISRPKIDFDTYVVSFAANSSVQAPYRLSEVIPFPVQIRSLNDVFVNNRNHAPGPLPIMNMDATTLRNHYTKTSLQERVALIRALSGTVLLSPTKSFHIRSGIPQKVDELKEQLVDIIDLTIEQMGYISTSIESLIPRDSLQLVRKNIEDTLRTGLIVRHTAMPFTNKASRNETAAVTAAQFQFFSFLPIAQQKVYYRKILNKYFARVSQRTSSLTNTFSALATKDRNERLALSAEVLRVWLVLSPHRVIEEAQRLLSTEQIDSVGGATEKIFRERARSYIDSVIHIVQAWLSKNQLDEGFQSEKEKLFQSLVKIENTYNWFEPDHSSFATDLAQMSLKIKTSLGYGYGLCVPVFRSSPGGQQNLDF